MLININIFDLCLNLIFFREDNNRLVPIVLDRLQNFYAQYCEENQNSKPFSILNNDQSAKENTLIIPSLNRICKFSPKFIY